MKLGSSGQRKAGEVMREFYHQKLHHGRTGKLVPRNRPDIAKAIAMSEGRKAQGKAMKHHSPATDEHAVTELHLYADNTGELYDSKMKVKGDLVAKAAKGVYDPHKAAKRWLYWVDEAAKRYVKEFGSGSVQSVFPAPVRREVAKQIEEDMRTDIMRESEAGSKASRHRTESEKTILAHGSSSRFPSLIRERQRKMATRKHHKKHTTHKASGAVDSRSLHAAHKPKRRSSKAPSAKQLAARKRFAEAARARAKAAGHGTKHKRRTVRHSRPAGAHHLTVLRTAAAGARKHQHLAIPNGHKVASLTSDIRKGLADLERAEKELHDAQKLLRSFKTSSPHHKGKKRHAKKHHTKHTGKKISVSQAIKLARGK